MSGGDITEQDLNAAALLEEIGGAWLCIDRNSGLLGEVSASAAELLGVQASTAVGQRWKTLLGGSAGVDAALARAIDAGVRADLPPVLVQPPQQQEFVAGGLVLPLQQAAGAQTVVFLRRLDEEIGCSDLASATAADTVVVLGVEYSPTAAYGSTANTVRMMDVRSGLIDIVRTQDSVGLPAGSAITLLLRDADISAAQDISSEIGRAHV